MAKYLISFPSRAMQVPADAFDAVVRDSHAVIEAAKAAGVYVFGGGLDESVPSVVVTQDGQVTDGVIYSDLVVPHGGYLVVESPSREDALGWAARIATACRCPQEVREFQYDPAS